MEMAIFCQFTEVKEIRESLKQRKTKENDRLPPLLRDKGKEK